MLHPGEFVLGSTLERVALPDDLVARIEGKSSLGRLGLLIHTTAGFIDAGFDGHITLELSNVANLPITLYPGMKIGQISFLRMTTPADVPYGKGALGSKYQGQRGPTPSRYWENFDSELISRRGAASSSRRWRARSSSGRSTTSAICRHELVDVERPDDDSRPRRTGTRRSGSSRSRRTARPVRCSRACRRGCG